MNQSSAGYASIIKFIFLQYQVIHSLAHHYTGLIIFRFPNGALYGNGALHGQVIFKTMIPFPNHERNSEGGAFRNYPVRARQSSAAL